MSDVPPEVLAEILSRLPMKSLLQCRAVSKPLCALIDSPYFINLHMNQPIRKPKVLTFLRGFRPSNSFYFLSLHSHPRAVKLQNPFHNTEYFHQILSSCNGLICLSSGGYNRELLLWNPSTRKYKFVPTRKILFPCDSENPFTIDRLGYDHVNDDYKIVRLSQYRGSNSNSIVSEVSVFSLKLNVWESVELDFPYHICQQRGHGISCAGSMSHGVSICGAIHWIVTRNQDPEMKILIGAFDLATQSFRLVPQPKYSDKYVAIDLGILGGCLCVVGNHELHDVDIWVMEKYGVNESWRKVIAMTKSDVMINLWPCVRPLMYIKNGKKVLLELDNEWFVRYDLEKKESKHLKIRDVSKLSAYVYQESLV